MQQVNALPVFISQDTDLKTKDSSSTSVDSNKDADFSSLVEQHLPEENKAINGKKSATTDHAAIASQGKTLAANDKSDVNEVSNRQESDSKESLGTSIANDESPIDGKQRKENEADKDVPSKKGSLAESEQFISLLYNSDQTLAKSGETAIPSKDPSSVTFGQNTAAPINNNNIGNKGTNGQGQAATVQSAEHESVIQEGEHKLSAFSKGELLARPQLKNNNVVTSQSSEQALKDYPLSLQSQQNAIKGKSITSEQLLNTQLATAQLNNKVTDLTAGVTQSNKTKLTENVDTGLYQLPVEPIVEGEITAEELSYSAIESVGKAELNQGENKVNPPVQSKGDINTELKAQSDKVAEISPKKTVNNALESIKVNPSDGDVVTSQLSKVSSDKEIVDRTSQAPAATIENSHNKNKTEMTSVQLQALQQVQAQQKVQSVSSEQQVIEDAGEESIDLMHLAEEKPVEPGVKTTGKAIENIAMRTVSELQAQTVQATQTKQSNDAYLEHQVSEVLNHSVASDTVQIQKNNIQLQQETISIFRKDFADAVKEKVMITINQKLQQFDITLDPPEFGNMQVRVNLQGEQASVNFVVQNQQAKDALEQNMHKLRDMLSEQGVDVGGANVEQQDQQQNQNEQSLGQNNDNGSLLANGAQTDEHNVEHILSAQLFDSSATGVDYYA